MRNFGRLKENEGKMRDAAFFKTRKEAQEFIDENNLNSRDPEDTIYSARKIRNKEVYGIFIKEYIWCTFLYSIENKYWLTYQEAFKIQMRNPKMEITMVIKK